ncbi:hypothetical protein PENTCL1PPCAC_3838, partial [Pristionchus entomophagus]
LLQRNDGSIAVDKLLSILFVEVIFGTSVVAIVVASVFIVRRLYSNNTQSEGWRRFHRQQFVALLVQLSIPCCLLYIPCTVFFVTPFLGLSATFTTPTWLLTTIYSIYPILDPLAIILLIRDYRRALFDMWRT